MEDQIFYFRPGEESRMLARCQFGLMRDARCSATLTYPIKGYPWRRNPFRSYQFKIASEETADLFDEVAAMPAKYPGECLGNESLWSDPSEKGNAITRRNGTDRACHTLAVYRASGEAAVYFSVEENSAALIESRLYKLVATLIAPHETLPTIL